MKANPEWFAFFIICFSQSVFTRCPSFAWNKVVGFQPTPGQGGLLVLVLLAST
ncbi:hypothetical protein SHDE107825_01510 [Shewanella denitrificans]|jgi:hypothetical protein